MNIFKKLYIRALSKYNAGIDRRLLKNLLADVSEADKPFVEPLLNNELTCLNSTFTYQATQKKEREQKEFYLRLSKHIINRMLVLKNIVGLQPMQGPCGLVYRLQYAMPIESETMRLEVVRDAVMAITRKLHARWSVEAEMDLRTLPGIDMVAELQSATGREVATDLVTEVVRDLQQLGLKSPDNRVTTVDSREMVLVAINQAATSIAMKTRRGPGNFIITSPIGIALLQNDKNIAFVSADPDTHDVGLPALTYAGNIVIGDAVMMYPVYVSLAIEEAATSQITFIIGYKGGSGEIDTGYIYSPYIPLMPSGPVIDPKTFQPSMTLMTRYGKTIPKATGTAPVDAYDYYRTVTYDAAMERID